MLRLDICLSYSSRKGLLGQCSLEQSPSILKLIRLPDISNFLILSSNALNSSSLSLTFVSNIDKLISLNIHSCTKSSTDILE